MSTVTCILCGSTSHYTDPDACYAHAFERLSAGDVVAAAEWRALANDLSDQERPA